MIAAWAIGNEGGGRRKWFVHRTIKWTEDGVPRSRPEVLSDARGNYRRFASAAAAQRAADSANSQEGSRGPGYRRMMERLGPDRAEALRQQVLHEQAAALSEAAKSRPPAERDRDTYQDYPPPKGHGR